MSECSCGREGGGGGRKVSWFRALVATCEKKKKFENHVRMFGCLRVCGRNRKNMYSCCV